MFYVMTPCFPPKFTQVSPDRFGPPNADSMAAAMLFNTYMHNRQPIACIQPCSLRLSCLYAN